MYDKHGEVRIGKATPHYAKVLKYPQSGPHQMCWTTLFYTYDYIDELKTFWSGWIFKILHVYIDLKSSYKFICSGGTVSADTVKPTSGNITLFHITRQIYFQGKKQTILKGNCILVDKAVFNLFNNLTLVYVLPISIYIGILENNFCSVEIWFLRGASKK